MLRYLAQKGLNPQQIKKYKEFVGKRANTYEVHIFDFSKGKAFQVAKPADNIPGSYSIYEQYVSNSGKTQVFGKRTIGAKGEFTHWKEKYPIADLVLHEEHEYLTWIEQILRYSK